MAGANLEIHYHSQDEASVFYESGVRGGRLEQQTEILMFTLLAARQLVNLGRHDFTQLGSMLAGLDGDGEELRELGVSQPETFEVVQYRGAPGRKRFTATVRFNDDVVDFREYDGDPRVRFKWSQRRDPHECRRRRGRPTRNPQRGPGEFRPRHRRRK
jgi:hypothetical protein